MMSEPSQNVSANVSAAENRSRFGSRSHWVLLCVILVLIGLSGSLIFGVARRVDVPVVEITGIHPSVSKLLTEARLRVEQQPESGHAWGHYGICLMQHERPYEALQCFREAIKRNSGNAKWPYFAGVILEQTNLQEAASLYETAIRLKSDHPPLLLRYAALQITLGNFAESSRCLEEIQKRFPEIAETYVQLVRLERLRGTPCESSRWVMEARRRNLVSSALLTEGASAEMQCGNVAKARLMNEEALSALPQMPLQDAWMNPLRIVDATGAVASADADGFRQLGQIERAAETLAKLARQFPERSRPALNHALTLRDQGRDEESLQAMSSLIQKFPDDPLVHFHLAVMLASSGRPEAAELELRECLRLKANYGIARAALGDLLEARGEVDEAIQCYTQAVNDSVGDPWIRLGLASLLIRQGQLTAASIVLDDCDPLLTQDSNDERRELERLRLKISASSEPLESQHDDSGL